MKSSSLGAVFALGLVSGACGGTTHEDPLAEESIESVQQAVSLPSFVNITKSGTGTATAECPAGKSSVMGAGALWSSSRGYRRIYITGPTFCPLPQCTPLGTQVDAQRPNNSGSVTAVATCSNAPTDRLWASDNDGDKTVTCGSDEVAVGGGGLCDDASAKLYRSRPSPDTNGSRPTGWRASCTSGGVTAVVTCVHEDATYDFQDCYTKRVDDNDADEHVFCGSGEFAVGVGAYCGDGSYIDYMNMFEEEVAVGCRADTIHAYAVCCPAD